MARNDGGPAFPQTQWDRDGEVSEASIRGGMSLRDWFAGHAMAADIAYSGPGSKSYSEVDKDELAQSYYEMADSMLKAREAS